MHFFLFPLSHPLFPCSPHALRLLQFPTTLEKGLAKLMSLKESFGGIASQTTRMLGTPGTEALADQMLGKLDTLKVGRFGDEMDD